MPSLQSSRTASAADLDPVSLAMQEIHLNASDWSTKEDFYTDLLPQLGAPAWHGHNLDALMDGISGDINTLEPPYTVYVFWSWPVIS